MKFFHGIILPLYEDPGCSGFIAKFDYGANEIRLIEGSEDKYFLSAIEVQTCFYDKFGIFFQFPAVHVSPFVIRLVGRKFF